VPAQDRETQGEQHRPEYSTCLQERLASIFVMTGGRKTLVRREKGFEDTEDKGNRSMALRERGQEKGSSRRSQNCGVRQQ